MTVAIASPHQTNQGSARSNAADNRIDEMPGDLLQNLTRGSELMCFDVFGVGELSRQKGPGFGGQPFRFADAALNSGIGAAEMDGSSKRTNHQGTLVAYTLGLDGSESEAVLGTNQRHRDAGGPAGGFNDGAPRLHLSPLEGVPEDVARDAVFSGAAGIEEFEFAPDYRRFGRQLDGNERRRRKVSRVLVLYGGGKAPGS